MRKCAVALSALLFSGCSIFGGDDEASKPMELVDFDASAQIEWLWSSNAGTDREGVVKLEPLILDDRIYTADVEGRIMAFDRASGDRLWQKKTGDPIRGAIGGRPGLLLYGTGNGELVAVSDQGGPPPVLTLRGTASPLMTSSRIIAAFGSGKIMAFNPDNGLILWEHRLALPQGRSEIEQMVDIDASPLMVNSILYTASFQGQAAALNRSDGQPLWKEGTSTHRDLTVQGRTLYITEANGRITARSTASGRLRWDNESLLRRQPTGPEVIGDYIAVADFEGYLHLMDPDSGEFVARDRLDRHGIDGPLIRDGETLYVLTNSGELIALRAKSL